MSPRITSATPDGGRRMDLRRIAQAGRRRDRHLASAERELDELADELLDAGNYANLTTAAKIAGVSRTTLYRRLQARREARR